MNPPQNPSAPNLYTQILTVNGFNAEAITYKIQIAPCSSPLSGGLLAVPDVDDTHSSWSDRSQGHLHFAGVFGRRRQSIGRVQPVLPFTSILSHGPKSSPMLVKAFSFIATVGMRAATMVAKPDPIGRVMVGTSRRSIRGLLMKCPFSFGLIPGWNKSALASPDGPTGSFVPCRHDRLRAKTLDQRDFPPTLLRSVTIPGWNKSAFAHHFDQRRPNATGYGQASRLALLSRHLAWFWIYSGVE
jgi:hypothetical protein